MENSNTRELYMCDICGDGKYSSVEMRNHMKEHNSGPTCPFCVLTGVTVEEMTLHVNSVHFGMSPAGSKSFQERDNKCTAGASQDGHRVEGSDSVLCCNKKLFSDIIPSRLFEDQEEIMDTDKGQSSKNVDNREHFNHSATKFHSCPICSYETDCADVLLVHINQVHFQETPKKTLSSKKGQTFSTNDADVKQRQLSMTEMVSETFNKCSDIAASPNCDAEMVSELHRGKKSQSSCDLNRTPSKQGKLVCPFCDTEFEENVSFKFHMQSSHGNEMQDKEPLDYKNDESVGFCPVCEENFLEIEMSLFEAHVNSHFTAPSSESDSLHQQEMQRREEQSIKFQAEKNKNVSKGSSSNSLSGATQKRKGSSSGGTNAYKKQAVKSMESAVARGQMTISDFYNQKQGLAQANRAGVDEGNSYTKDIIPRLQQFLSKQCDKNLVRYWLASPTDHYAASHGDRGWGCGYRNLQMLLSYLVKMPVFHQPVFNGVLKIPSIPKLQQLIESAWSQGYDPQAREQLTSLLHTTNWIGATEICAVLSSLKVKCKLIDFHCPTGPAGTHPQLFEWVKRFYSSSSEFKPPLYLQHQGHSRTIIGIQEYKDGHLSLLMFDPSTPMSQMRRFITGDIDNNKIKGLRRNLSGIKAKQYQIVAVQGLLTNAEQERSKLLTSQRIP